MIVTEFSVSDSAAESSRGLFPPSSSLPFEVALLISVGGMSSGVSVDIGPGDVGETVDAGPACTAGAAESAVCGCALWSRRCEAGIAKRSAYTLTK